MARNVTHSGKPSGADAIVSQRPGETFVVNDHAKFDGRGKISGKTPANGVEEQGHGPTFTCNETLIPTPNADKTAKESKLIASRTGVFKPEDTADDKTASQPSGEGGPTDRSYPLRARYDKHGSTESKGARNVFGNKDGD